MTENINRTNESNLVVSHYPSQQLIDELRVLLDDAYDVVELIEKHWYTIADDMCDRDIGLYRPSFEYFINELPRLYKSLRKCKTNKTYMEIKSEYEDRMPPRYTYTTKEGKILPYKGELA